MIRTLIASVMLVGSLLLLVTPIAFADVDTMRHGLSLLSEKKYSEALADFVKVAKADPSDEQARYCAAVCYHFLSRYPEACRQYKWVSENGKNPDLVRRAQKGFAAVSKLAAFRVSTPTEASAGSTAQLPGSATTVQSKDAGSALLSSEQECPGKCLKMSMSGWTSRPDLDKDPNIQWMLFPGPGGTGGHWWSTRHLGEVIEYDADGNPVNKGKCPVCGGTGKVRR